MSAYQRATFILLIISINLIALTDSNRIFAQQRESKAKVSPQYQFGQYGNRGGEFNGPMGIAIDRNNRIFVADTFNHRVEIFDINGRFLKSWGSAGSAPGELAEPKGIAFDDDGLLYLADSGNNRIQVFSADGKYLREFGNRNNGGEKLRQPFGLAISGKRVFVADPANDRIAVFTTGGEFLMAIGGAQTLQFNQPSAVAIDEEDAIYVADSRNHRVQKFNARGEFRKAWGTFGGYAGQFSTPIALAYRNGELYVADQFNNRVEVFDREGNFRYEAGHHWPNNQINQSGFHAPIALAVTDQSLIVAELAEARLQVCNRKSLTDSPETSTSSQALTALHHADQIAVDSKYLAVSLADTHQVMLFDVFDQLFNNPDPKSSPKLIGQLGGYGSKFGQLNDPAGLAIDSRRGVLYVSDSGNHRIQVYQISILTSGKPGSAFVQAFGRRGNGPGEFQSPAGLSLDADGNLYVCDLFNSRIEVFNPDGKFLREWPVTHDVQPASPRAISIEAVNKRVYLLDSRLNRVLVYDLTGKLQADWPAAADQTPEKLLKATALIATAAGEIYLSDTAAAKIIKLDKDGARVSSWGGWGESAGQFRQPRGLAQARNGNIFVVDTDNHRLQLFYPNGKLLASFSWEQLLKYPPAKR